MMTNFEKVKMIANKPQEHLMMELFASEIDYPTCLWAIEVWYDEFLMSEEFHSMEREKKMRVFQVYKHLQFLLKTLDDFEEYNEINGCNPD